METISKDRVKEIEAILDNVSFDIEVDGRGRPECVAFEYDTKTIYLNCYVRFDGSSLMHFTLHINNIEEQFTEDEKDLILKRICQVHKDRVNEYENEERRKEYDEWADQDHRSFVNANFHQQY